MNQKYACVTVGGTFDHLHKGHEILLQKSFAIARKVKIALTVDGFSPQKQFDFLIQSYEERKKAMEHFLKENNFFDRAEIIPIADEFGFAPTDKELDGIVVTEETKQNALTINERRRKNSLPELGIILVPLIIGNDNVKISSSRIRAGEIDRGGFTYSKLFASHTLHLPQVLRDELRKPFGEVKNTTAEAVDFLRDQKPTIVITVGDIVARELEKSDTSIDLKVVDYKTQRHLLRDSVPNNEKQIINKAGTIEPVAAKIIHEQISSFFTQRMSSQITIDGEEDLLVIPAVLFAPLNSVVLYGQQNVGVVVIHVTEEKKKEIRNIVEQFTASTTG